MPTRTHIRFALAMALFTGGLVTAMGVWWNRGIDAHFWDYWSHSMIVAYPTIVFCILVIAPPLQRWAQR